MAIPINWTPTTPALHKINQDLVHRGRRWPKPNVESPLITKEELNLARGQWAERLRATYLTTTHAAALLQRLLILGAPLELISGATYTVDELSRHLGLTAHIYRAVHPSDELDLPAELLPLFFGPPTWKELFDEVLELFIFNLNLSIPVQEAIEAVTFDTAISELAAVQAKSLAELLDFGRAALEWMVRKLTDQESRQIKSQLPALLAAYEELCHGSPTRLDALAGQEIVLETQAGNLGTLSSDQLAASFYHTLNYSIFPTLDELGWDGMKAWQDHHRLRGSGPRQKALITAIGSA